MSSNDPRRSVGAYSIGEAEPEHRKRGGWLPLLLLLGLLLLGLLLWALLHNRGDDTTGAAAGAAGATASASAATTPPPASVGPSTAAEPTVTPDAGTGTTGNAGGAEGRLTAAGQSVLPLSGASTTLSQYAGKAAKARAVRVQSVPADEGFWVGSSKADRVWVQLSGAAAESPFKVKPGDHVDFDGGKLVPTAAGFPAQVGVTGAEGARQLVAQKQHIQLPRKALSLSS